MAGPSLTIPQNADSDSTNLYAGVITSDVIDNLAVNPDGQLINLYNLKQTSEIDDALGLSDINGSDLPDVASELLITDSDKIVRGEADSTSKIYVETGVGSNDDNTLDSDKVGVVDVDQIARSIAVQKNMIEPEQEFDYDLSVEDIGLETVSLRDFINIMQWSYLIDIRWNDGSQLRLSTASRPLTVREGYFGALHKTRTFDYAENRFIIDFSPYERSSEQRVDESPGGGLDLYATAPGLLQDVQLGHHIGAIVTTRLIAQRDGHILLGPIKMNTSVIESAVQSYDVPNQLDVVRLEMIQTWSDIKSNFGKFASSASYKQAFDDDFFDYSQNVQQYFTWRSRA